jgi:cytochrome c553
MFHFIQRFRYTVLCILGAFGSLPVQAQSEPSALQVSIWASSCMACHGSEGRAEVTGLIIGGKSAEDLFGKLMAYRSGAVKATIMHQHVKGYSEDELRRIATYFSSLK